MNTEVEVTARALRVQLAQNDMNQGDLAKALGISDSALSKRISGHIPFEAKMLRQAARVLRCTVHDLMPLLPEDEAVDAKKAAA